ncbi:MAG: helix-turn-helix domain-containing protein [Nanoarchaeota archaeon]|nr:helix-turn-helix domain-containing protein [Nanoarchaeota archaeon]
MANSIMVDLDDPRTEKIADVISNKTSKKILSLLAEGELSESEIANKLEIPLNTVGYNIKKLEEVGLIEKVKGFLWSVKGKRIHKYRVSNRKIVISPKHIVKGVIPSIIVCSVIAFGIKVWINSKIAGGQIAQTAQDAGSNVREIAVEKSIAMVEEAGNSGALGDGSALLIAQHLWLWFLAGALVGVLVLLLWNSWRRE